MLQNTVAAAWRRDSGVHDIHLDYDRCFIEETVFKALIAVEEKYPKIGSSLVGVFFPNGITLSDVQGLAAERQEAEAEG
jgi:hypothetical protein